MANPAELLHTTLTLWRPTKSHPEQVSQRIAARHLDAIDELLGQMEAVGRKTDIFRREFPKWCELTFRQPDGWQTENRHRHIDDTALDHLYHLADRLDELVPTLIKGGIDQLRDLTASARTVVDGDGSIDPQLKQHVKLVIAHLNWCIDNYDAVGDFDLQEAVERLVATMLRTATVSAHKEDWRGWMDKFTWPFAVNVLSGIPTQALTQLALGG